MFNVIPLSRNGVHIIINMYSSVCVMWYTCAHTTEPHTSCVHEMRTGNYLIDLFKESCYRCYLCGVPHKMTEGEWEYSFYVSI